MRKLNTAHFFAQAEYASRPAFIAPSRVPSGTRRAKSITVQTVQGLQKSPSRTEYALRLRLRHKRLGIGWRGIVHKSFLQRISLAGVVAETLNVTRPGELFSLLHSFNYGIGKDPDPGSFLTPPLS
jgi:hypothetical protein